MIEDALQQQNSGLVRRNLSEQVAEQIKNYIIANDLRAGDRLPTESELAERFGVSRVSVREATRALAFLGILDSRPRRGLTIAKVDMARVSEYVGFHLALSDFSGTQFIDTRVALETGALPFTSERMAADPTIYDDLSRRNEQLLHTRDPDRWVQLDEEFHRSLLAASGVEPLLAFNDLLALFFRRFRESVVNSSQWSLGIEGHQQILELLRDGSPAQAAKSLRQHIESHKNRSS